MLQVMHEGKLIQILPVMDVNHQKHLALKVNALDGCVIELFQTYKRLDGWCLNKNQSILETEKNSDHRGS